jgi:hypothetical protein
LALRSALAVRAGDHDHEAIRIAQPDLPVLRRRVYVGSFDYLSVQVAGASYGGVKVLDLEPQDDSVPDRRCGGIDQIGMIFLVPSV